MICNFHSLELIKKKKKAWWRKVLEKQRLKVYWEQRMAQRALNTLQGAVGYLSLALCIPPGATFAFETLKTQVNGPFLKFIFSCFLVQFLHHLYHSPAHYIWIISDILNLCFFSPNSICLNTCCCFQKEIRKNNLHKTMKDLLFLIIWTLGTLVHTSQIYCLCI